MKNFSLLFILFALACSSSSEPSEPPKPKLSSIQKLVFTPSCTFSACHNDSAAMGNLKLTAGNSYSELVDVLADNDKARAEGKKRVVPGNADASFLIHKLEGPDSGEGDLMPRDNESLDNASIAAIREWIELGAKNN